MGLFLKTILCWSLKSLARLKWNHFHLSSLSETSDRNSLRWEPSKYEMFGALGKERIQAMGSYAIHALLMNSKPTGNYRTNTNRGGEVASLTTSQRCCSLYNFSCCFCISSGSSLELYAHPKRKTVKGHLCLPKSADSAGGGRPEDAGRACQARGLHDFLTNS